MVLTLTTDYIKLIRLQYETRKLDIQIGIRIDLSNHFFPVIIIGTQEKFIISITYFLF